MCSSVHQTWKLHFPFMSDRLSTFGFVNKSSKELSFLIQAISFFVPRSHDVKNGGEPAHPNRSPGQSSPHPGISQQYITNKQATPGFTGPQLPSHVMKVTLQSGKHFHLNPKPGITAGVASSAELPALGHCSPLLQKVQDGGVVIPSGCLGSV